MLKGYLGICSYSIVKYGILTVLALPDLREKRNKCFLLIILNCGTIALWKYGSYKYPSFIKHRVFDVSQFSRYPYSMPLVWSLSVLCTILFSSSQCITVSYHVISPLNQRGSLLTLLLPSVISYGT